MKRPIPTFKTDKEAEDFVETADSERIRSDRRSDRAFRVEAQGQAGHAPPAKRIA